MKRKPSKKSKPNEPKPAGAGRGGNVPPADKRWPPGTSGNPKGRPTAGASVREWYNALANKTAAEWRKIVKDERQPGAKRVAAADLLTAIERPDITDFTDLCDGEETLDKLRGRGVDTSVVKRLKTRKTYNPTTEETTTEREVELHNRSGGAIERIVGHTELSVLDTEKFKRIDAGKATEAIDYQPSVIQQLPLPAHFKTKKLPPAREV